MDASRLRYAFLLLFLVCFYTLAWGQSASSILDKSVTLPSRTVRLDTLLKIMSRQTGAKFSYNSRRLKTSYRLQTQSTKQTVGKILTELKQATGVLYTVIENQIILNIEKSTVQKPIKTENKNAVTVTSPARSLSPPVVIQNTSVKEDQQHVDSATLIINQAVLPDSSTTQRTVTNAVIPSENPKSTPTVSETSLNVLKADSTQKRKVTPKANKVVTPKKEYFVDLGVDAEETLFAGATLQGGLSKFFGSIAFKSNGKSNIFLYGVHTALRIKEKSRIILGAEFGPYSKSFTNTRANMDSTVTTHKINLKGAWARVAVGVEWKINRQGKWKFYTGLNFNALESRYTVNGKNGGLDNVPVSNPEREFSAFYPFYTITNNYEDVVFASMKTWVGVQVGIRYQIFHR